MGNNRFALQTIHYIWSHPNCQKTKTLALGKFIGWQIYKRCTRRFLDFQWIPGIKIRCYPDSRSASAALYCGLYDYEEMNFLLRYLRSEDSFIDIGANIGIYSLLAASRIKSGIIYSVEALPKNYERLLENLKLNHFSQIKPFSIAISDRTGNIALDPSSGDSLPFIALEATKHTITVSTQTLDNFFQDKPSERLTLAKMDIEGAEMLALMGATNLLKQQRPPVWILEINDTVAHFGHREQDVMKFLQKFGYGLYGYRTDTQELYPIELSKKQGNNVLAIATSALDFVRDRLAEEVFISQ